MRIGLITTAMDIKNRAGIGWYCYHLVSNLLKIDKKNEYFLIHRIKSEDSIYNMANEVLIKYPKILFKETIGVHISAILKKLDLDIIHHLSQVPPFTFDLNAITMVTIHDLAALKYPETFGISPVFDHKYILPYTLRYTDLIIADSKYTKKDISEILNYTQDKIKVVYLGVDNSFKPLENSYIRKKYGINERTKVILYVSTIEPRKNMPVVLKAMYKLKKKKFNLKLLVVGKKGWKYQSIFKLIEKLKLWDDVIFSDYVSKDDLPKIYSSADVFVYPSLYEGFGLPVLEAMACGTPVVASNRASIPEVVGDAGILLEPDDVAAWERALNSVLTDEDLRDELRRKGLKRAKLFTWEKTAKRMLKIYHMFQKY